MKKIIYPLIAIPLFFASCNNEGELMSEETVQMTFCAEIPQKMGTRASTDEQIVDQVVCAVFENDVEISNLRKVIAIGNDEDIVFSPALIKGRTYDVVFWAMKAGSYNVSDMTAITRVADKSESAYDAFTATTEVEVSTTKSIDVTLTRPFAKLNIGTTSKDWEAVASAESFNMKPEKMTVKLSGIKDTFNALTGQATGTDKNVTYNLPVTGADFIVGETTYKSMAACLVLAESEKLTTTVTYSVFDADDTAIRENVEVTSVPLQRNYQTNIIGGLLTSTINFTINLGSIGFSTDSEFDKILE